MNVKEIRYVVEGLMCCADDRDCECCPYQGEAYCEDSVKTDAAELLKDYEATQARRANGR